MKRLLVISTVLAAAFCCAPPLLAKTFYLKDGTKIDYQHYWQKEGRVYVLINRDTLVDFAPAEVDLKTTDRGVKGTVKQKVRHVRKQKRAAVPPSSATVPPQVAPAAQPVPVAKPTATPAKPAATAPPVMKPAPAAKPAGAAVQKAPA